MLTCRGTAYHVFSKWARQSGLKEGYLRGDFIIKAGKVGLRYDIEKKTATATIPHDFHIHSRKYSKEELLKLQPQLSSFTLKKHYPVVSVVKGMTFILVELESEEVLAKVSTTGQAMSFDGLDQDWNETFVGMYFFVRYPDQDGVKVLRTRMIEGTLEDPATGSAASDLAGYLSLTESQPKETVRYQLTQGVEMGRRSDIFLEVKRTDGDGIAIVNLEGSAVQVMEGRVQV
jgi:PhzF family phenazine biosynthesis protein